MYRGGGGGWGKPLHEAQNMHHYKYHTKHGAVLQVTSEFCDPRKTSSNVAIVTSYLGPKTPPKGNLYPYTVPPRASEQLRLPFDL